jgi:hypothetical protein
MTTEELAWLAGLLEGEGSFFLAKKSNGFAYPRVSLNMTDEDIIQRVASMLERRYWPFPRKPPRKTQYALQLEGRPAIKLMEDILPFMGIRRSAKIQELIQHKNIHIKDR